MTDIGLEADNPWRGCKLAYGRVHMLSRSRIGSGGERRSKTDRQRFAVSVPSYDEKRTRTNSWEAVRRQKMLREREHAGWMSRDIALTQVQPDNVGHASVQTPYHNSGKTDGFMTAQLFPLR
jgi:hypothetical protein